MNNVLNWIIRKFEWLFKWYFRIFLVIMGVAFILLFLYAVFMFFKTPPKEEQTSASADNYMPTAPVLDETSKSQQDDGCAEPSDVVKMVEYNEYKVSGTRMIAKFPGAEGRHKDLPVKIELKVRCVADNPEQCECIDGPSGPYPGQVIHTVPCDIKRIKDVENVHKHGTINNFEKLLKLVKQSPEKHQYAVSFMDIKPEKDKHSDFQAIEIRKLCPVQDGIISDDCECFKAESHDPNTFFITSGRVTNCP